MIKIFGIKNCDTVRKALKWFDEKGVSVQYHDFRADGMQALNLEDWLDRVGSDKLVNKRSTSWKALSDEQKKLSSHEDVIALLKDTPTLIKRPVIVSEQGITVGFSKAEQNLYEIKYA